MVDRVKLWIQKVPSRPSTRQKLQNATKTLRLVRSTTDPSAVLQRISEKGKIKFCAPCKKFALTASAYTREASTQNMNDVDQLAVRTVDWLCRQSRIPSTVKALLEQIDSFNTSKELGFKEVWDSLVAQGVVEEGVDTLKYNLAAIQVDERYLFHISPPKFVSALIFHSHLSQSIITGCNHKHKMPSAHSIIRKNHQMILMRNTHMI